MVLSRQEFRRLVGQAIRGLPQEVLRRLDNVDVVVEDWPTPADLESAGVAPGATLLGLYTGVPLTQRGTWYGLVLPDKITLFQRPIQEMGRTRREVIGQIRITLLHEIGHHFGLSEDELAGAGME